MKRLLIYILTILMLFNMFLMLGCDGRDPADYSEKEHIVRISERVQKKFIKEEYHYTGFSVSPLYDEKEKLVMFLVEFEPVGFIFVQLREETSKIFSCLNTPNSMYHEVGGHGVKEPYEPWSPYTCDKNNGKKTWILDENGEMIYYTRSPFYITGNQYAKKYFLYTMGGFVCAIKQNGEFINLIDGNMVNIEEGDLEKYLPGMGISYIPLAKFDL